MKHWNYRIVHRIQMVPGVEEPWHTWYPIEAYYDEADEADEVVMWSECVDLAGDSLDEVRDDLARVARALELPVLEYEDLPRPKKENSDAQRQGQA